MLSDATPRVLPRLDATAVAVAMLAACYAPSPPEGARCGAGDACPSRLGCHDGVCTRTAGATLDAIGDSTPIVDAFDARLDAARDGAMDGGSALCPATYTAVAGQTSKYRAATTAATWSAAEQDCENDGVGTHLAVIDDMAEDAAIDALTGASIWFGLTDLKVEGTPRWVTGAAPAFTNDGGQGNTAAYDCSGIYRHKWAWGDCSTLIRYVCECDGVAADPTAY